MLTQAIITIVTLIVTLICLISAYQKSILRRLCCRELSGHPTVKKYFIIHILPSSLKTPEKLHQDFRDIAIFMRRNHPNEKKVVIWVVPLVAVVLNFTADSVKPILKGSDKIYPKSILYRFVPFLKGSIITENGDDHRRARKIMNPAFSRSSLEGFIDLFNRHSLKMVQDMSTKNGQSGQEDTNLLDISNRLFLDIITDAAFGEEIGAIKNASGNSIITALDEIANYCRVVSQNPLMWSDFLLSSIFKSTKEKELFARKTYSEHIRKMIRRRLSDKENDEKDHNHNSLISLMLSGYKSGNLSESDIIQNCQAFIFAGTETSANTFACAGWVLARNPEMVLQLRQELEENVPLFFLSKDDDQKLKFEDTTKLPKLEAFIKETLRIYNPILITSRTNPIANNLTLGTAVDIIMYDIIHKDPKFWGSDPYKFDLHRFLDDKNIEQNPFSYIPFSAGVRNCIGQHFAKLDLIVSLAYLLKYFDVSSEVSELDSIFEMTFKPKNAFVTFKVRK